MWDAVNHHSVCKTYRWWLSSSCRIHWIKSPQFVLQMDIWIVSSFGGVILTQAALNHLPHASWCGVLDFLLVYGGQWPWWHTVFGLQSPDHHCQKQVFSVFNWFSLSGFSTLALPFPSCFRILLFDASTLNFLCWFVLALHDGILHGIEFRSILAMCEFS